jgi:hypothetical protein
MVQCTICFHWCHAACEGYSKDEYSALVEDPNSVFHCSRCQFSTRKPAPRPISEAEAIAEAAAEAAAAKLATNRLGRKTGGSLQGSPRVTRGPVLDSPARKTGSLQELMSATGLEVQERVVTPKRRGRPGSAPKPPGVNTLPVEQEPTGYRPLGAALLRSAFVTVSPKRARSNAAIKASRLKSSARVRSVLGGWGKSLDAGPPLTPRKGQNASEGSAERDHSRTGRRLKTPARLMELGQQDEGTKAAEGDQEGLQTEGLVAPLQQPWKKKLAASVVAAKLGKVAGKRKRAETEALLPAGDADNEGGEAPLDSVTGPLGSENAPLRPGTPGKQKVAFAPEAGQKTDASPRKLGAVKVGAKQRIRHLSADAPWCGDRRHPPQAVVRFSAETLCALEACKVCGGLGDRDEDEYLCCVDCGEAFHSFCLEPPLRRTEKLHAFWRCPTCKLCEVGVRVVPGSGLIYQAASQLA